MKNKKSALLGLLLCVIMFGHAQQFTPTQQKHIDSFNSVIQSAVHDTAVAKAYYNLSEILYLSNIDTLRVLCEKSAEISRLNLKKNLNDQEVITFKTILAGSYNNLGYYYKSNGDIPKGLEYYYKSLEIDEELSDDEGIAVTLNNIGGIYKSQGDYDKAIEIHHRALSYAERTGNKKYIALMYNNLGYLYHETDRLDEALTYHTKSLKLSEEIGNLDRQAYSLNNLGITYKTKGDSLLSIQHFSKAEAIWKEIGNIKGLTSLTINKGKLYFKFKENKIAKKYAQEAFDMAQEAGYVNLVKISAIFLSEIHQEENNWKAAFDMNELAVKMRDSIKNADTEKAIIRQRSAYEIEKRDREIELLATQNELQEVKLDKNRSFAILISVLLGLSMVLIFFVIKNNRRKQVINNLLHQQNEAKSTIIKEIHHRVKNNLHVVNSLLRRQVKNIDDDEVVEMFKVAQSRVVSMAILHEKMYKTSAHEAINVKEHLERLAQDLVKAYEVDTDIKLKLNIEQVELDMETLVPLGLIINELITNSLKYAFKNRDKGIIYLSLQKNLSEGIELLIGDDGVGIQPLDASHKESMGTQIINTFVRQLNGTIDLIEGSGTLYKVAFSQ